MITGPELGALLFSIHDHVWDDEGFTDYGIIYHEEDILKLLKKLGLPDPEWGVGGHLTIDTWEPSYKAKHDLYLKLKEEFEDDRENF